MASINPAFVQSAVRIRNPHGNVWGTAFGYVRPDKYDATNPVVHERTDNKNRTRMWYVTCAHVLDGIEASQVGGQPRAVVEVNEELAEYGLSSLNYPIPYYWTRHRIWVERCSQMGPISERTYNPEDAAVDVAVTTAPTHYEKWNELARWAFPPKSHLTKSMLDMKNSDDCPLSEGDEVFIVGFPTGYYKDSKNWPVVRHGVLAQIQPYLRGKVQAFLVDGSVFPGNSGGPVVTKPQAINIEGTAQYSKNSLIGMVSGYQPYKANPANQENADLGIVVPLDAINDTIDMALQDSPHLGGAQPIN